MAFDFSSLLSSVITIWNGAVYPATWVVSTRHLRSLLMMVSYQGEPRVCLVIVFLYKALDRNPLVPVKYNHTGFTGSNDVWFFFHVFTD